MKNKNLVGFNKHRLNPDDEYCMSEIVFMDEFHKYVGRDLEAHFIQTINPPDRKLSERELRIALSVVQWFATNCGKGFYETAEKKIVANLREHYKKKRIDEIEMVAEKELKRITFLFNEKQNKSESDYMKFALDINEVFKRKKTHIDNIPEIY